MIRRCFGYIGMAAMDPGAMMGSVGCCGMGGVAFEAVLRDSALVICVAKSDSVSSV